MLEFGSSNGDIVAVARGSLDEQIAPDRFTVCRPPLKFLKHWVRESMEDLAEISRQLIELRIEHRDLDVVIARLVADPSSDELQLRRLKKRKLRLKDMISYLENKLIPDLDA
jgi:hypothetical protein